MRIGNGLGNGLIVVLGVIVAGLAIYVSWYVREQRRKLLRGIAARLGGRFHADDPFGLADRHERRFATLRQGSNRYAYNVVDAEQDGRRLWIFDHHHETYSHSNNRRTTHHHHRTFVLVEHDLDLGEIEVRPEGFFDKLKAAFGFDDVDFESDEFSRKWYVGARDRKLAYAIFHPRMIEYFLTLRGLRLSTGGRFALYRIGSGRMNGGEIERTLGCVRGFAERLPRFLRKDRAL